MKKILTLLLGFLFSSLFIYLSLKDISFSQLNLKDIVFNYKYLFHLLLLNLLLPLLRSIRLKYVISHVVKNVSPFILFPITATGYFLITLFPLRLGEFFIPFYISKKYDTSMTTIMGSIIVERVIDVVILLFIFLVIIFTSIFPISINNLNLYLIIGLVSVFSFILILYYKIDYIKKILSLVINLFSDRYKNKLDDFSSKLLNGFKLVLNPYQLIQIIISSLLIYSIYYLIIFSTLKFQNLQISMATILLIVVANIIAIILPAAPGMVGNVHYACIWALTFDQVSKNNAFIFSNIYYIISVGMTFLVGIISMQYLNLSFRDIWDKIKSQFS